MQFDNYTGFLLKQIQGQQEDTYSYLGADNHSIFYSLYRLGIFRLRQAVQQPFRCGLSYRYDNKCGSNHRIYHYRRILSGKYNRLYTEHHYVGSAYYSSGIRHFIGRRCCRGNEPRNINARIFLTDTYV